MYGKKSKRMLTMKILEVLKKYSDSEHRLSQKDIIDILRTEHDMIADRKTVKRHLMHLLDSGYPLEYSDSIRCNKNGEEEVVYTDWYLEREFTDVELRLLIDSLFFSKHIPHSQCRELIKKLENQSNRYFKSKMRHVQGVPNNQPQDTELFFTLELLDEAIEKNKQVIFHYVKYEMDKKQHYLTNAEGEKQAYLVNPYQLVATNGNYYLIGNLEKYDNISHYRLDRIKDIKILENTAKPQRKVKGLEYGLNLPKHMAEHIYMFSGESQKVIMRTVPDMVGELIDWFGNDVTFTDATETSILVHVTVNLKAMRYWALQYAPYVTILSPQSLAEIVKDDLKTALQKYESE